MDLIISYPAFVISDVKAIAKSWNVLIGGLNFFKETFLTKTMKSITIAWVSGPLALSSLLMDSI